MFQRFTEYREMQQLRRDHRAQQRRRQLFIFLGVLGTLLMVLIMIEAVMPGSPTVAAPVKTTELSETVKTVPDADPQETQELQDIQAFADAITKPLDTLTPDDLDLIDSKASDPCYETNDMMPKDQMIQAISACKKLLK